MESMVPPTGSKTTSREPDETVNLSRDPSSPSGVNEEERFADTGTFSTVSTVVVCSSTYSEEMRVC